MGLKTPKKVAEAKKRIKNEDGSVSTELGAINR